MKKIIVAIFFIVLFFPNRSFALLADMSGIVSWQTYSANGTITIHVDQICNKDPGYYSGTIRVGVWAFTQQFYGQTLSGYILGSFTLGERAYNACWINIDSTVTYSPPPCGNYYTYVMTETWDGLWYISDWASTGYKYICVQPTTTTSINTTTILNSTTTSTISVTTTTTVQPTTTTTPGTSTTTTPGTSTTTSTKQKQKPCPAEEIYGEDSEETELLREYRDNVLSKTPDGQEFIKNYYKFSSTVTKLLESRPLLKNKAKMIIDSMLPGIREKVEEGKREQ
jgi:hypothetical protein